MFPLLISLRTITTIGMLVLMIGRKPENLQMIVDKLANEDFDMLWTDQRL